MASEAEKRIDHALHTGAPVLDLSALELRTLPDSLAGLHSLAELDLTDTYLSELPTWLKKLSSLERIDLNGDDFDDIPKWASHLVVDCADPS
ncbi:hypothetical protein [Nonomuraea sp. NPDC050643]|uniref:hypothetical protein n=1 Tax=Nonomuraea sp. NPDC050643 TaxID=3155660 RepID=UPI0033C1E6D3